MAEYIEREAAKECVKEHYDDAIIIALDKIPAADARLVVHGFNMRNDYPSLFECSVCGWCDDDTTTGDTRSYNFCPNCGADMGEKTR